MLYIYVLFHYTMSVFAVRGVLGMPVFVTVAVVFANQDEH